MIGNLVFDAKPLDKIPPGSSKTGADDFIRTSVRGYKEEKERWMKNMTDKKRCTGQTARVGCRPNDVLA